jgi:hypothetical protein
LCKLFGDETANTILTFLQWSRIRNK